MKQADVTEENLLKQIAKGNRLAFNSLYQSHWESLYQSAFRVLRDEDLSKDAVQEVFFDFWKRRESLKIDNLEGYLYRAVRFQSLKQLRKTKLQDIHHEHFQNVLISNTTEEQLELGELESQLDESLKELPEKYRLIFEMSRNQNFSNKEIAEKLQLSQRTVDWYLHTTIKHLKGKLSLFLAFIAVFLQP